MKQMFGIEVSPVAGAVALSLLAGTAMAAPTAAEPASPIDKGAMTALHSMGAYLRALKDFQVEAVTTEEVVLEDGQKIQYSGTTNLLAQLPNRLWAEVASDRRERQYFYDGKTFTLYAKRLARYASVPAPETIGKLADQLEANYVDLSLPLVDLFRWGSAGYSGEDITAAADFGASNVSGVTCQHYAYRQRDIDWQVWVQKGAHPLPRKIVITSRTDEARPQYVAIYGWNLAPSYSEATFSFLPPQGASRVALEKGKPVADAAK